MVGDLSAEPQTAAVDLGKLKPGLATVRDEYAGQDLPVAGNRVTLALPARHFALIGF